MVTAGVILILLFIPIELIAMARQNGGVKASLERGNVVLPRILHPFFRLKKDELSGFSEIERTLAASRLKNLSSELRYVLLENALGHELRKNKCFSRRFPEPEISIFRINPDMRTIT